MHIKSVFYSLDEKITPSKLKRLDENNIEIDKGKFEIFSQYCKKNNINSFVGEEVFLKKTKNLPYILYYIGDYDIVKSKKIIGIVGHRKINNFIKKKIECFL